MSLAKRRGFIFQSSEIYGGVNAIYDFGPLGVALRRNIRDLWWRHTVELRHDVVGLESAIIMHPRVWEASGHVQNFTDPLVDCQMQVAWRPTTCAVPAARPTRCPRGGAGRQAR